LPASTQESSSARGYGAAWKRVVAEAIADHPFCAHCGATEDLTGDHIVPRSKGGRAVRENVQVLCRPCNARKGNR
jgi:5-methylcytosine-specific restriction endonuclease McrA